MGAKKIKKLTGKQARFLRGVGHHLRPLAMVGKEGISLNLLKSVAELLTAHELVKVKLGQGCALDRGAAAEILAEKTGAAVAQVIGKIILLYRANPDRQDDGKIVLP